jgi:hypothetical protein
MAAGAGTVSTGAGPGRPPVGESWRRHRVSPSKTRGLPEVGAGQPSAGGMGPGSRTQSVAIETVSPGPTD